MIRLKRAVGLTGLTLYGLGVTLGAGIYALIGEMSGAAGLYAPLAFLLAGGLAAFTGLFILTIQSCTMLIIREMWEIEHSRRDR
mgnify:CR=1 FL=1